jgi:hypothetical protein
MITAQPTQLLLFSEDLARPCAVAIRKGGDRWVVFPEPGMVTPPKLLRDAVTDEFGNVLVKENSFTWEELQAILEEV